jgi:hypothetical protein
MSAKEQAKTVNEISRLQHLSQQQVAVNQCLPPKAPENEFNLALVTVQPYAAERNIPREDSTASNAYMAWIWGEMNPKMRAAVDEAIKGEIANGLRMNAPDVPEVMHRNQRGREDPNGARRRGESGSLRLFCTGAELFNGQTVDSSKVSGRAERPTAYTPHVAQ